MSRSLRTCAVRFAAGSLTLAISLSACADGANDPPSSEPSESGSDSGEEPVDLEFVIDNLQVSPAIGRVPVDIGDAVRLSVTSDVDDSIHVHGVERFLVLTADEPGVLDFTVPPGLARGVYPVEAHDGGVLLFELRVR